MNSDAYLETMKKVKALGSLGTESGSGEGSIAWGISLLLKEGNLTRLKGLAGVVGKREGFMDLQLEVPVRVMGYTTNN